MHKLLVHVTTLNCAGRVPNKSGELVQIFQTDVAPDIICVGLQEMVSLNAMSMIQGENTQRMTQWRGLLDDTVRSAHKSEQYIWLTEKGMVGLYMCLFVKHSLISRISDIQLCKIKTGVWGSSGNKGAVLARFNLDDTSVVLMNCHLMSGKNKGKQRTEEINYIFDNMFKDDSTTHNVWPYYFII